MGQKTALDIVTIESYRLSILAFVIKVSRRFNVSMDQLSKDELELELPPPAGDDDGGR